MFRRQFLCPSDETTRISRRSGTRSDFFRFGCEQSEFPGALDRKVLGYFRLAAHRFQIENIHVPRADCLATYGIRIIPVISDSLHGQPETKHSAQYPAQVESSAHVAIIARNFRARLSTGHGGKR